MNRQHILISFILSVILGGCVTVSTPAIDVYTIDTTCEANNSTQRKTKSPKILKVLEPRSSTSIASQHILYQKNEFTQNPYAYSAWNDAPNKMLGSLFLSCISKNSIFTAVLPSRSKGKSDFLLESMLLDFYHNVNIDGSSEGRVRIVFYLIEKKNGRVIATKEFFSKVDSNTLDAKGGVKALNDSSKSIALTLTQWISSLNNFVED